MPRLPSILVPDQSKSATPLLDCPFVPVVDPLPSPVPSGLVPGGVLLSVLGPPVPSDLGGTSLDPAPDAPEVSSAFRYSVVVLLSLLPVLLLENSMRNTAAPMSTVPASDFMLILVPSEFVEE